MFFSKNAGPSSCARSGNTEKQTANERTNGRNITVMLSLLTGGVGFECGGERAGGGSGLAMYEFMPAARHCSRSAGHGVRRHGDGGEAAAAGAVAAGGFQLIEHRQLNIYQEAVELRFSVGEQRLAVVD